MSTSAFKRMLLAADVSGSSIPHTPDPLGWGPPSRLLGWAVFQFRTFYFFLLCLGRSQTLPSGLWEALEIPESGNSSCLLFTHFTIHGNYSTLTSDKFLGSCVVSATSLPYKFLTTGNSRQTGFCQNSPSSNNSSP